MACHYRKNVCLLIILVLIKKCKTFYALVHKYCWKLTKLEIHYYALIAILQF